MSLKAVQKTLTGLCLILGALYFSELRNREATAWVVLPADLDRQKIDSQFDKSLKQVYQILSFGFTPALSDLMWMKALQDDTLFHIKRDQHTETFYLMKTLLELDTANFTAYNFSANFLSVIRDDVYGAVKCLELGQLFRKDSIRGLATYPHEFKSSYWNQEWIIPFYLAYIHWAELSDLPTSSPYFLEASLIEGSPPYLKSLSEKLKTTEGQYKQALFMLGSFYTNSEDLKQKAHYKKQLDDLTVGYELYQLNQEFRDYKIKGSGDMNAKFKNFLTSSSYKQLDHKGGLFYLDETGIIRSKTERKYTFGLPY